MDTLPPNVLSLDAVLSTPELERRPPRVPDYESENLALVELARAMASSPQGILDRLAETALELCRADSAGLSLLETEDGRQILRWHAVAGRYAPNVGGHTPREFSPCGTVLDRKRILLFSAPGRHFPYLDRVSPPIVEALLVPLVVAGEPVGTIWVMANDDRRKFDAEDARVLSSLATFAAAAYQVLSSLVALRTADRHKSEFLALLGHELRNPLAPLRSAVGVLRDVRRPEDLASVASMMERQIKHLVRLVDDLLDLGRIRQGKLEVKRETIDLAQVVRQAVDQTRPFAEEKKHALELRIPELPIYVEGDATRLVQVVGNLLSNAYKFMEDGGRVDLEVQREGDAAVIRVRDRGIGLARHQLRVIFEMYEQLDASANRLHGGLGIGLALAKTLVESHGGAIEATSAGLGQGSTFTVRLPLSVEQR